MSFEARPGPSEPARVRVDSRGCRSVPWLCSWSRSLVESEEVSENGNLALHVVFLVLAGSVFQIRGGRMENFVHDPPRQHVDLFPAFRREMVEMLVDFSLPYGFELIAQFLDRRNNLQRLEPAFKLQEFLLDNLLNFGNIILPAGEVVVDDMVERIDIVEKDAADRVRLGIDVSGEADIDNKERLDPAQFHRLPDIIGSENVRCRFDAAHHDVDVGQF